MIAESEKGLVLDPLIDKLVMLPRKYMLVSLLPDPFYLFFDISEFGDIVLSVAGKHA